MKSEEEKKRNKKVTVLSIELENVSISIWFIFHSIDVSRLRCEYCDR